MENIKTIEESEDIEILEDEPAAVENNADNITEASIEHNTETKEPIIKKVRQVNPNPGTKFPYARIKKLMKMDPEVVLIEKEAVVIVGRATELFIDYLTSEAAKHIQTRKTLLKRDVDVAIESVPHLCFLDGALE